MKSCIYTQDRAINAAVLYILANLALVLCFTTSLAQAPIQIPAAQTPEEAIEHLIGTRTMHTGRRELERMDPLLVVPALVSAMRSNAAFDDVELRSMAFQILRFHEVRHYPEAIPLLISGLDDSAIHIALGCVYMLHKSKEEYTGQIARAVFERVQRSIQTTTEKRSKIELALITSGLNLLRDIGDSAIESLNYLYDISTDTMMSSDIVPGARRAALKIGGIARFVKVVFPSSRGDYHVHFMLKSTIANYGVSSRWSWLDSPQEYEAFRRLLLEPLPSSSDPYLEHELRWIKSSLGDMAMINPHAASQLLSDWRDTIENYSDSVIRVKSSEVAEELKDYISGRK